MRRFQLGDSTITAIIFLCFVLATSKSDLWGSLVSQGADPTLDQEEYEKALCALPQVDCYKFGSCHDYDGNEEDCADWAERCTYQCDKCYANSEIANPDDGIPQCPSHYLDTARKCKFTDMDKYLLMNGGICFQAERTKWKHECTAPTIFLAMNLNGDGVEASSGILYETEVLHSGEENRLSGKSDATIYKVVDDEEVEISEKDRVLYETWVSPVQKGDDGERKCLVYEVLDIGRNEEYFGLVLTFLEENWQPGRYRHITVEFEGSPLSFKIDNFPFKTEGRTYVHDVDITFEVLASNSNKKIYVLTSESDNWLQDDYFKLQASVGPMLLSICSGDCSQSGNDPTFRLAALLVKRYSKQGRCNQLDDPVECVMDHSCVYNTYYKRCGFDESAYLPYGGVFPKLRPQAKYRCLRFSNFVLFSYGRPWKREVANADSSCAGVVEVLARNFHGRTFTHPEENVIYMSVTLESLREEAEQSTLIEGIDRDKMEELCQLSPTTILPWDYERPAHDRYLYGAGFELVRILSPKGPQCITYNATIKETGYYQLKTKLMVPYLDDRNERMFDIMLNGILAAPTIDAAKMNDGYNCKPLEVALFFEVVDSVSEGIRILEFDEIQHSKIRDETMTLSFCNSPSEKLRKGAIINGFSLFKYTV